MLNFGILYKKRIKEFDSGAVLDLTESTLNTRLQVEIDNIIVVSKEFAGKPTAIAFSVYGTEDFADMLFAFNGYSNMFRVNEGDVLVIPNVESMLLCLNSPEDIDNVDKRKTENNSNYTSIEFKKKLINRDINRIKVIAQNTSINFDEIDIRKPNMSKTQFFESDGNNGIVLGTNISEDRCRDLSEIQTKSEIIRQSVRKRLISEFESSKKPSGKLVYDDKSIKLT